MYSYKASINPFTGQSTKVWNKLLEAMAAFFMFGKILFKTDRNLTKKNTPENGVSLITHEEQEISKKIP